MAPKNEKPAVVVVVTEELVGKMIAEAIKDLLSKDQVIEITSNALKDVANIELVKEMMEVADKKYSAQIDKLTTDLGEYVSGLVVTATKDLPTEERIRELIAESSQGTVSTPVLLPSTLETTEEVDLFDETLLEGLEIDGRPMTTDDILSGFMQGNVVTIISKDGQKHVITKE